MGDLDPFSIPKTPNLSHVLRSPRKTALRTTTTNDNNDKKRRTSP
jgi:hypothetical protein